MALIKEEAAKAGLEILLDGLDHTISFEKTLRKEHHLVFMGWGVTPPHPRFYQFFYSKNAFDEKGNPKQQTNNINVYANPEMDKYVVGMRHATTDQELQDLLNTVNPPAEQ